MIGQYVTTREASNLFRVNGKTWRSWVQKYHIEVRKLTPKFQVYKESDVLKLFKRMEEGELHG